LYRFDNVPAFKLPSVSFYQTIEKEIKSAAESHGYNSMPATEYANRVVGDILAGKTGTVQRGNMASIISWWLTLLPKWLVVSFAKHLLLTGSINRIAHSNTGPTSSCWQWVRKACWIEQSKG
jgi:hypothetical protein